jgi:hypothetical protein
MAASEQFDDHADGAVHASAFDARSEFLTATPERETTCHRASAR